MSSPHASALACALAAGVVWSVAFAVPAHAQQQIPIGTSVTASIDPSDPVMGDGSHYKVFTFMGSAGQTVQIDMISSAFDAYLFLRDQSGTEITHDDDGGGGLNSRIVRTLTYSGIYQIVANTARASQFGAFTLQLQGVAAAPTQPIVTPIGQPAGAQPLAAVVSAGVVGTIGLNQQVQNTLTAAAARYDGKPFQAYNFDCATGQAFQMDILSDWDNYAMVFDPFGNEVAHDDDGGEGLNARIQHTCTMNGTYHLAVSTYSASTSTGPYTMRVQALGTPAAIQPQPVTNPVPQPIAAAPVAPSVPGNVIPSPGQVAQIALGQTFRGRIEPGDSAMTDGTFYDLWQFQGSAGQTVTIEVRSDEFDTYVQLLDGNRSLLADDSRHAAGGRNSRIVYTLQSSGVFQIVVNNSGGDRVTGIYTLSLR